MQYMRARAAPALGSEPWNRLDTSLSWPDLVLPLSTLEPLREVPALFSERFWTASPAEHGDAVRRGVLLLFAGGAGTGKTSAAKVLGNELRLPVLEADLRQIFARGRIEATRLIARLFATAQRLTAVLVLEGADVALSDGIGAPSPRIAATDIAELWRHCESHPGIVIFPTTRPGDVAAAVRARFDVAIEFPFPEPPARHELWRRALPAGASVSEGDLGWLAGTFALPGGAIAAVATRAQQAAQAADRPIELEHIADALEVEYASRPVKHAARAGLAELRRRRGVDGSAAVPALVPLVAEPEAAEAAPAEPEAAAPAEPEEAAPPEPEAAEPAPPAVGPPAPEAEPLAPPHEPPAPAPVLDEPPTTEIAALEPEPKPDVAEPAEPEPAEPEREPELARHGIDDAAADRLVQTMSQAPPAPPARRRTAALRLLPVALIGLASAIALGLAAAKQRTPTTSTSTPAARTASTPQMKFSFPGNWQIGAAPAVSGLPLSQAVAMTSSSPAGRLIIGFGSARDDRPLPSQFIAATLTGTPTPQLVTLGSNRFYRVLDPRLSLGATSQSVYALPTAGRPVIAVCKTSSQTFAARCEHVLATLQVTAAVPASPPVAHAAPAGPRPDAAYAAQLSRVLATLNTRRTAAAHTLADAPTLTDQEAAAALLASLHGTAADQVGALHATGPSAAANAALATSLRTLANAYGTLAFALLYHETGAYPSAEAKVAHANADVRAALAKLSALGYAVG